MRAMRTPMVLVLLIASAPLAAQAPALPPQVASADSLEVSNTVHCAYDQMSTEDREMALLLFQSEINSGSKSHLASPYLRVIDRLVDEARQRCARPFGWSTRRGEAAGAYALNEVMSEGVAQTIVSKGRGTEEIERYFDAHRRELAGLTDISGAASTAFRGYLFEQGWSRDETAVLGVAEFYLESLISRDAQGRFFAAAPLHQPAPGARRVVRRVPPAAAVPQPRRPRRTVPAPVGPGSIWNR